MSWKVFRS